jgi:hypothetical protein
MKILFWNIRGFGKPARRRHIRDYIREERVGAMGLQETIKEDFTQKDLGDITGDVMFLWIWKSARVHSGGILMGVREEIFEVEDMEVADFYVSMVLRQRVHNFRWELITVYGLA